MYSGAFRRHWLLRGRGRWWRWRRRGRRRWDAGCVVDPQPATHGGEGLTDALGAGRRLVLPRPRPVGAESSAHGGHGVAQPFQTLWRRGALVAAVPRGRSRFSFEGAPDRCRQIAQPLRARRHLLAHAPSKLFQLPPRAGARSQARWCGTREAQRSGTVAAHKGPRPRCVRCFARGLTV